MRHPIILAAILAIGSATWAVNFLLLAPLLTLIAADVGVSDAATGQLATIHSLATGVTALAVIPWMDRVGRGRLLRIGVGLLIAGTVCSALAPGFAWLFPARLLAGIGAAFVMPVCLATAGDLFPDSGKRNQAVGLIIAATGLGPAIGLPLLTQIADSAGWRWATAALLLPLALLAAGSALIPSRPASREPFGARDYLRHYRHVLGNWETNWLLSAHLVRSVAWYSGLIYLGAFVVTVYGLDANRLSLLFASVGVIFFIATNVMPLVTRVISARRLYALSILVLFANLVSAGWIDAQWGAFVFFVGLSVAGSGVAVAEGILLLDSFPSARGGVMSLRSASAELGTAAGSILAGVLLVAFDDYATVFRALGLLLPFTLVALHVSVRRHTRPEIEAAPLSPTA